MQINEVDNFTTIIKHEIILNEYPQEDIHFILYGYFFQDIENLQRKKINFKFNLISKFIISSLIKLLSIPNDNIKKKYNSIIVNNSSEFNEFISDINKFVKFKNIRKNDFRLFCQGWFLRYGSVSNLTAKYYHLELKIKKSNFIEFFLKIFKKFNISFKFLERKNFGIFYLKKIDQISDFLKFVKTNESMMKLEDKRIEKDSKNFMQRWENLDLSNALKTNFSSESQINIIRNLKKYKLYDSLNKKEKLICEFRIKNKELSLSQLADKINAESKSDINITKSSISYIFKKLNMILNGKK